MKRKDVERKIYEEFNERKPDLFQSILEQCPKMTEQPVKQPVWKRIKDVIATRRFAYSFASLAIVVLLALIVVGLPGNQPVTYSVIAIDVNPSVVLELDEDDVVINVLRNNADADVIIGDMDLVGVDANIAVNALIGSMVANGFINEITNSVLLSIQSSDATRQQQMIDEYTETISTLLSGSAINGSVMTQALDFSEDAEELAEQLDISEAKAELILRITNIDPRMLVADLAKLSINDLNLLLEAKNYNIDNVRHVGAASNLGILTADAAYQAALNALELDALDVLAYEVELEQEDGVMIYEIEIETATDEFEILITAKDGTIFEETEDDDPADPDDDPVDDPDDDDWMNDVLSETAIINLVAAELGLEVSLITELEFDLELENGIPFYAIAFVYQDQEYELEVNAETGYIFSNSVDEEGYNYQDEEEEDEEEEEEDTEDPEDPDDL